MKLRWSSLLSFLLSILFLFSTLFITSCDSDDDDEKNNCRLFAVRNGNSTMEFVYNVENKIEVILFYGDGPGGKANLEYNDKGLLSKMVSFNFGGPEIVTYELIYDDHDKPQELRQWDAGDDPSGPPSSVVTFSHDGNGRLVKRAVSTGSHRLLLEPQRFEYNNENNVTKIFYGTGPKEYLWLENLSFDTKSKYYSLIPEIETLNIYVFLYQPGRNNPLTAIVYTAGNLQPTDLVYTVNYDENGRITFYHAWSVVDGSTTIDGSSPDFDEITYTKCPL